MCPELGIERNDYFAYHQNYINKVMALAVTAYAFDGDVENGGESVKLAFLRVQAARIAMKEVREAERNSTTGAITYSGPIKRRKGDVYMVDVNVTGSDEGTSKNPKFSLLVVFRDIILPKLKALTMEGGDYEGFTPIIQGDNAGPHQN